MSVLQNFKDSRKKKRLAFTLAEVLITLGILGVVSAMTIPSLLNKYQELATETKVKKFYTTLQLAERRAIAEYDEPEAWDLKINDTQSAKAFWQKYYLDFMNSGYVTIPTKRLHSTYTIKNMNDNKVGTMSSGGRPITYFSDGGCVELFMNNQFFWLVYDTNCAKGPNILGKDVWDLAEFHWLYNTASNSIPGLKSSRLIIPQLRNINNTNRASYIASCKNATHTGGAPSACLAVLVSNGWKYSKDFHW